MIAVAVWRASHGVYCTATQRTGWQDLAHTETHRSRQLYFNCLLCITSFAAFHFDRGSKRAINRERNAIAGSTCIKLWLFLVMLCLLMRAISYSLEAHVEHPDIYCKDRHLHCGKCPQNHDNNSSSLFMFIELNRGRRHVWLQGIVCQYESLGSSYH